MTGTGSSGEAKGLGANPARGGSRQVDPCVSGDVSGQQAWVRAARVLLIILRSMIFLGESALKGKEGVLSVS